MRLVGRGLDIGGLEYISLLAVFLYLSELSVL